MKKVITKSRRNMVRVLQMSVLVAVTVITFLWALAETTSDSEPRIGADGLSIRELANSTKGSTHADANPNSPSRKEVNLAAVGEGIHISGQLIDGDGNPISDGTIGVVALLGHGRPSNFEIYRVALGGESGGFPWTEVKVTSNGMGSLFLPLQASGVFLYGRAPGKGCVVRDLGILKPEKRHDAGILVLPSGGTMSIQTESQGGASLDDVAVCLQREADETGSEVTRYYATSDSGGMAELGYLEAGYYEVRAEKHGFAPFSSDPIKVIGGEKVSLTVTLTLGGKINGRVNEVDGDPCEGVEVFLSLVLEDSPYGSSPKKLRSIPYSVMTNHMGQFEFSGVSAGMAYKVRAVKNRERTVESDGVFAGDYISLVLPGKLEIAGQVLQADGNAASHAWVKFFSFANGLMLDRKAPIVCDEDGQFRAALFQGRYGMVIWHDAGEMVFSSGISVTKAADLGELVLSPGGSLEISVISHSSKGLIDDAKIEEVLSRAYWWDSLLEFDPHQLALSGAVQKRLIEFDNRRMLSAGRPQFFKKAEGLYQINGLAPGRYRFQVSANGHAPSYVDVQVHAGVETSANAELMEEARLKLRLIDTNGNPIPRTPIGLQLVGIGSIHQDPIVKHTDQRGVAKFSGLMPSTYRAREGFAMFGFEDGSDLGPLDLSPGENEFDVYLPGIVRPTIVVQDGNGPIANCEVRLYSGERFELQVLMAGHRSLSTNAEGEVQLPGVRAGTYKIEAMRVGGFPAGQVFRLDDDSVVVLNMEGLNVEGRVIGSFNSCRVTLTRLPDGDNRESWLQLKDLLPGGVKEAIFGQVETSLITGSNGEFSFSSLPPGDYQLSVSGGGVIQVDELFFTLFEESLSGLEIETRPAGRVVLKISGIDRDFGLPLIARVTDYSGNVLSKSLVFTGNLEYTLDGCPLGGHLLRVFMVGKEGEELIEEFPVFIDPDHEQTLRLDARDLVAK